MSSSTAFAAQVPTYASNSSCVRPAGGAPISSSSASRSTPWPAAGASERLESASRCGWDGWLGSMLLPTSGSSAGEGSYITRSEAFGSRPPGKLTEVKGVMLNKVTRATGLMDTVP